MVIVSGTVRMEPDKIDAAREPMRAMVEGSRAEAGCLAYAYAQDLLDPGLIHVIERWRDEAALQAHFQTPHMAAWRATWSTLKLRDRNLLKINADEGTPM